MAFRTPEGVASYVRRDNPRGARSADCHGRPNPRPPLRGNLIGLNRNGRAVRDAHCRQSCSAPLGTISHALCQLHAGRGNKTGKADCRSLAALIILTSTPSNFVLGSPAPVRLPTNRGVVADLAISRWWACESFARHVDRNRRRPYSCVCGPPGRLRAGLSLVARLARLIDEL